MPIYKGKRSETEDNSDFNLVVAHLRVVNEHCIGILKSRFSSLKGLRTQIRSTNEDTAAISDWMTACIVLHNLLCELNDPWDPEDEEELSGYDEDVNNAVRRTLETGDGQSRREAVKETCLAKQREPGSFLLWKKGL